MGPRKYFELYNLDNISLPENRNVPRGFKEENWHANGNAEMAKYENNEESFSAQNFGFHEPLPEMKQKELRRAYFAATSFLDAQVGTVLDGLAAQGYEHNT